MTSTRFTVRTNSGAVHSLDLMLFTNVTNAAELRGMILAKTLDIGLCDATRIADPFTVAIAANKALHMQENTGKLRAASIHAEILFCLWAGRNMAEALRSLGAADDSKHLLICIVNGEPSFIDRVKALVKTEEGAPHVTLEDFYPSMADSAWLTSTYKVVPAELTVGSIADAVTARIAIQEFTHGGGVA